MSHINSLFRKSEILAVSPASLSASVSLGARLPTRYSPLGSGSNGFAAQLRFNQVYALFWQKLKTRPVKRAYQSNFPTFPDISGLRNISAFLWAIPWKASWHRKLFIKKVTFGHPEIGNPSSKDRIVRFPENLPKFSGLRILARSEKYFLRNKNYFC